MRKAGWTPAVEAAAVPLMWLALASGLPKFGRAGVFRDQVFRVVGVPEDYFLVCFLLPAAVKPGFNIVLFSPFIGRRWTAQSNRSSDASSRP